MGGQISEVGAGSGGQDEDRADSLSVAAYEVGDEVACDAVWSALTFCDDSCHEGLSGGVPFKVDSSGDVWVGAVKLCPSGASAGGLLAGYGEIILFQTPVVSEGFTEASAAVAGYLDDALHFLNSCRLFSRGPAQK